MSQPKFKGEQASPSGHPKSSEDVKPYIDALAAFSWLDWTPAPDTLCYKSLRDYFPGAMPGPAIDARVRTILAEHGFDPVNSILGTSICPDEINNEKGDLADIMKEHWGECFPLGGIGGAPFVGKTGFAAFSSHVPNGGNVVMLFGPHVAISEDGEVGKYLRVGQEAESTACGACIGAYNYLLGRQAASEDFDENDMQMAWIKAKLAEHAKWISSQQNPMAALAYKSYDAVKDSMFQVVHNDFGSGKLAILGGIQINMPSPYQDHFLPLLFELRQAGKEKVDLLKDWYQRIPFRECDLAIVDARQERMRHMLFSWLRWGPSLDSPVYSTLQRHFRGALPGQAMHARMVHALERKLGFTPENTLVGTSVCPDEINNETGDITDLLRRHWGATFPLGGISGAPFVGTTGFGAFSAHTPEGGNVLVFFGPHVAISSDGEVGKYLREGQSNLSTACGAVIGAYCACCQKGNSSATKPSTIHDMQMDFIKSQIAPHAERISGTEDPMASLALQSYEMVKEFVQQIVNTKFGNGYLALIGGVQINMPPPFEDYFLPLTFEVQRDGAEPRDLLDMLFDH